MIQIILVIKYIDNRKDNSGKYIHELISVQGFAQRFFASQRVGVNFNIKVFAKVKFEEFPCYLLRLTVVELPSLLLQDRIECEPNKICLLVIFSLLLFFNCFSKSLEADKSLAFGICLPNFLDDLLFSQIFAHFPKHPLKLTFGYLLWTWRLESIEFLLAFLPLV